MSSYNGSCHCGAVTYTVEVPSDAQGHILCHCNACKMQSGGEYTLNQIIPKDNFKLTKGNLKIYTYKGDSGNPVDCYFCANCTSSPYHHQHAVGEDKIVLRTGLLKGTENWGKPPVEIYTKDMLSFQPKVAEKQFNAGPQ